MSVSTWRSSRKQSSTTQKTPNPSRPTANRGVSSRSAGVFAKKDLSCPWPGPLNAALQEQRQRGRKATDRRYAPAGTLLAEIWLSSHERVAAERRLACKRQAGASAMEARRSADTQEA